jgi:hypothetical protein
MEAWTHYFTFYRTHKHCGHWVEITATSNKKAQRKMEEIYGSWDKHYSGYSRHMLSEPKGCLARHEVE